MTIAGLPKILVPASIGVIFTLLLLAFGSLRASLVLLLAIPFAFVGGITALYLRDMNLNVSSGVGFAAVFGVSIVRAITELRLAGVAMEQAIVEGAVRCVRPILAASLVAILGLVPASLATAFGDRDRLGLVQRDGDDGVAGACFVSVVLAVCGFAWLGR